MITLHLIFVFIACVIAAEHSPRHLNFRRQYYCPSGQKICGKYCIYNSYHCCPDLDGGCSPTENCYVDNGIPLCCPIGATCDGNPEVGTAPAATTTTTTYVTPAPTTTYVAPATTDVYSGCDADEVECGSGCIPAGWDCCPDQSGGCDPDVARCWLGDNGEYGCCLNIYTQGCTGDGGPATTIYGGNSYSYSAPELSPYTVTVTTTDDYPDYSTTTGQPDYTTTVTAHSFTTPSTTGITRTTHTTTTTSGNTATANQIVSSEVGAKTDVSAYFAFLVMALAAWVL